MFAQIIALCLVGMDPNIIPKDSSTQVFGKGEVPSIEAQSVASRQRIGSGHVKLVIRRSSHSAGVESLELWCNENAIRTDIRRTSAGSSSGKTKVYSEKSSKLDDMYYWYHEAKTDLSAPIIATKSKLGAGAIGKPIVHMDLRAIGMHCSLLGHSLYGHVDSQVANPMRDSSSVTHDTINGISCEKVVVQRRAATWSVWIAPERDFNPIRFRIEDSLPNGERIVATSNIDLQRNDKAGIWFPSMIHYESGNGSDITQYEDVSVEVESLNHSISDDSFTFVGMNLPKGHIVQEFENKENLQKVWDGSNVVYEKQFSNRNRLQPLLSVQFGAELMLGAGAVLLSYKAIAGIPRLAK